MNNNFLSSFTPSLMSPAILEAIFVQRHKLVADLIESVVESAETANKHFRLLIGMRGIGKTHLIALIYHRFKATKDLENKLLIAWLKEEEWGVSSWLDLLLRIFQALEIEYPQLYKKKIQTEVESLYQLSAEDATNKAEVILTEFIGDKTLLLLTENLDEIFKGLNNIGQKQFRAYLQNHNQITIIATSQSLFTGVSNKDSPFYGFFAPQYLEKLTIEEATNLLSKIAEVQRDKELEYFIKSTTGKDRIQAIHHLAGGNHRVYIIFSQFLTRNSLDELVQPVMQTLDELTPYYQARMQWLSPQQRKIIELLCDKGNALPVKEIAQQCFISHQTASSQLKDLLTKGYVVKESAGRESFYELQEPLMRICLEVKKQRGEPIKLFIDFLRIWYTEDELKARLELLPEDCLEREYICHVLKIKIEPISSVNDNDLIKQKPYEKINLEKDIFFCQKALLCFTQTDAPIKWAKNQNNLDQIMKIYMMGNATVGKSSLLQSLLNCKYEDVIESYGKAIKMNPDDEYSYFNRIEVIFELNNWQEGFKELGDALNCFANKQETYIENTAEYIRIIWNSTIDIKLWEYRIENLVEIYDKYQVVSTLSKGIIDNIPNLIPEIVSDKLARNWLETWQSIAGDKPELSIALRLLKTAVEYKETKGDRRVLFQLAKEEREILEPLVVKPTLSNQN